MLNARDGNELKMTGLDRMKIMYMKGVDVIAAGSCVTTHLQVRFQNEVPDCEGFQR